jgi:ArsR family transcriptional regulator
MTSSLEISRGGGGPMLGASQADRLGSRLKALADPTRLRILSRLLRSAEPVCACELAAPHELGQPTISHHLKTLRKAGLVRATRRGTWIYYSPDRRVLGDVRSALESL